MQYIFDVDGTLSFDGKTISPLINRAIKDLIDADNEVIFASARPIRDLLPMIPSFTDHKLIGANGAMISLAEEIKVISKIPDKDFMLFKNFN
jgi:Predicted hydrolases of the HAD superfamily